MKKRVVVIGSILCIAVCAYIIFRPLKVPQNLADRIDMEKLWKQYDELINDGFYCTYSDYSIAKEYDDQVWFNIIFYVDSLENNSGNVEKIWQHSDVIDLGSNALSDHHAYHKSIAFTFYNNLGKVRVFADCNLVSDGMNRLTSSLESFCTTWCQ